VTARRNRYRFGNVAASIVTVIVLISAAGRIKDLWLHAQGEASPAPSSAASSAPAETGAAAAEPKSTAPKAAESKEEEPASPKKEVFLWINFVILVGAFWYLLKKYLGPFLKSRGEAIREDMRLSSQALEDANKRLSAIEDKLQRLNEEIGSLRNSALEEAATERARIEERSKADAQKISQAAEQEIAAAAKLARQELKVYASELAIGLAEKKIRDSISAESEGVIFRSFLEDLKDGDSQGSKGMPGPSAQSRRKGGS
jgi:F-type H+-transporting ATPase subunit b